MRVAILGTRGIPARYGGFETFAEKLAVGLSELGFDVTVFCESGESSAPDVFQGVKLRYVSAPSLGPLQTILYDLRCLWTARKEYDVVYMLGYGAAPFCLIPRLWSTQVWINPDGLEWARAKWGFVAKNYFRLMEWISLHAANRIIADAEAIAASLAGRHGKLLACTVIPYGCEVIETPPPAEPLSEWRLVPDGYYLVVCRLEPENHVLEILQAFQQSNSNRELIIVGNHLTESRYVAQLRAVQDPRIRIIGTVYDQVKLIGLRYHCFAYLHGHSVGGTNPSLLEAMGCGNLIFAHDNPFNRETLGPCGFYFANALKLTQAIDRAEGENNDLAQLKEASKSRARANYHWPDIISRYAALLERKPAENGMARYRQL
jgi:glycosyltransferase involved in cell wall biosynthesis